MDKNADEKYKKWMRMRGRKGLYMAGTEDEDKL